MLTYYIGLLTDPSAISPDPRPWRTRSEEDEEDNEQDSIVCAFPSAEERQDVFHGTGDLQDLGEGSLCRKPKAGRGIPTGEGGYGKFGRPSDWRPQYDAL
jgi:hypothetical protein